MRRRRWKKLSAPSTGWPKAGKVKAIGASNYSASGFLTGEYRSEADFGESVRGGRMAAYLNARGGRVLAALDAVAAEAGATPAKVALAWLAAQPGVAAPIASATSLDQLEELLGVLALDLGPDQIAALDAASGS